MTIRLAINGFGRIGRMVYRAALDRGNVDVIAVNDLGDPETMAHLLKYDSVHGRLNQPVKISQKTITVGENETKITSIRDPESLPWAEMEIDVVAECTGIFRKREAAAKHLQAGAKKVIISAPAENPDITIVLGVNDNRYDPGKHHIISNASCTTNCLAPVARVLMENFGIREGLMTTIHSYTGDQRILDFPHKDLRRARAAALSMVPTSTGAARAVALVLPELEGKLNGMAVRVPTPNVSLVDFVAAVEKTGVTVTDINEVMKEAAENRMKGILSVEETPLVSCDYNGSTYSSVVDAPSTQVIGGLAKVLAWYDNERGYSTRMTDLAALVGESA